MNEALEYIKSMYNGEIPYRYGRDECAKLMTEYAEYYHKQQVKKLTIPDVSISLERAKKYAAHQHYRGTIKEPLVEFEEWEAKD